jgi:hypothetical protein
MGTTLCLEAPKQSTGTPRISEVCNFKKKVKKKYNIFETRPLFILAGIKM